MAIYQFDPTGKQAVVVANSANHGMVNGEKFTITSYNRATGTCTGRSKNGNNWTLYNKDWKLVALTIDDYVKELTELQSKMDKIQLRLRYMREYSKEEVSDDEFVVFNILAELKKEHLTLQQQAEKIAAFFSNSPLT